jgi:hypothetical protein
MMTKELNRRDQDAPRYDIELKPLPDNYQDGPLFIDASSRGNKTRFINHSCEPNCIFEKWQREGLPIIKVVALQDIDAGTELTVDYHWGQEFECFCNSSKCRYNSEGGERVEGGSKSSGQGKRGAGPPQGQKQKKRARQGDRIKAMDWSQKDFASQGP